MLLLKEGWTEARAKRFLDHISNDYRDAELGNADRVMLDYARKLTLSPAAVTADDVGRLRGVGFDDRAIHDICAITGYYAFVNRLADGLGVELEERFGR